MIPKADIVFVFFVIAVSCQSLAFLTYLAQIIARKSSANVVAFALGTCISSINYFSFAGISANWMATIVPKISIFGCLSVTILGIIISSIEKKWTMPTRRQYAVLAIALGLLVLFAFVAPKYVNLFCQAGSTFAFWPVIVGVKKDPKLEYWPAWAIWCCGFASMIALIIVSGDSLWRLMFPCLFLLFDSSIVYFTTKRRLIETLRKNLVTSRAE